MEDRRSVLVGLTPHGLAVVDAAGGAHLDNEERLLGDLSPTEREQLEQLLARLG